MHLSTSLNSLSACAFLIGVATLAPQGLPAQVSDPIPESIQRSPILVEIEPFVTIPQSSSSAPRARINHVKPMRDSQGRLAVNDLRGKLYLITNGVVSEYTDLDDVFPAFVDSPGLGTGFGSFAFHPDFANNGRFYTAHSESPSAVPVDFPSPVAEADVALHGVVTEWTADDPAAAIFSGTRKELFRVELTHTIHGMQDIAFNPNASSEDPDYGMLYVCIGDGGATIRGFPMNTHRLDSVLGTILRIDPAGSDSVNGQYGVPADNPWATDGDPDTFGEIWAYGFRNPHRISWDAAGDGKMLSGDIGERNIEEVNLIEPGRDYGWNLREGTFVINPDFADNPSAGDRDEVFPLPADDASLGFTYPVAQYDHDEGAAILGGYVYRGSLAPLLQGKYIFGDILGGEIYFSEVDSLELGSQAGAQELSLVLDGSQTTIRSIGGSNRADLRFGYDEDDELYLLEKSRGMIFKVVGASDPTAAETDGKLVNISTRGVVGIDDDVLIGGFVIGEDSMKVLIQAVGPELANTGVAGVLMDPVLELINQDTGTVLDSNDNWEDEQGQEITDLWNGSPPLAPGSLSAGIVITLDQGSYTAKITGKNGTVGVALIEVYEVN